MSGPSKTPRLIWVGPSAQYVLDLSQCELDSVLLAGIVSTDKTIRASGGRLALAALRPDALEVMRLTGLDRKLEIHETTDAARAAIVA